MAEHLPYYGHEQGCYNSKIPWGPEPCSGCVSLRRAFSQGQRDEQKRIRFAIAALVDGDVIDLSLSEYRAVVNAINEEES